MSTPSVVFVRGDACREEGSIAIGAAILPGMLVKYVSGGVSKHNGNGTAVAPFMLVRENHEHEGDEDTVLIPQNDSCVLIFPKPGDVVNVPCDSGINAFDNLTSAGDGTFRLRDISEPIIAVALEDEVDNRVLAVVVGGGAASDQSV